VSDRVAPWVRVGLMLVGLVVMVLLAFIITGEVIPSDPKSGLVFQSALLLIVLGSTILESYFTKPADSVVNSLGGFISLVSVYSSAPLVPWIAVASYCVLVFFAGILCVSSSTGTDVSGWRRKLADMTYRPAVVFGRARVLFTVVFLSGIYFFYSIKDQITITLVVFWGIYISLWPLQIPQLLTSLFDRQNNEGNFLGDIVRIDSPNIVRVALDGGAAWSPLFPKICNLPSGESCWLQPLFSHFQDGRLLATGLVTSIAVTAIGKKKNCVIDPPSGLVQPSEKEINLSLGGGQVSRLVGYVVERSGIRTIRFETLELENCYEGMLVWSNVNKESVYYQIISGETQEESFLSDKYGFRVATAVQLGTLKAGEGFTKFDWLPGMNTPVFSSPVGMPIDTTAVADGDFELGVIPKTKIKVGGTFSADFNSHTAILGVTGSGKTELAFDLIRHAVSVGINVVCIDLTSQYKERLSDLSPIDLSIDEKTSNDLGQNLFNVETGAYGAGNEKKILSNFSTKLREEVSKSIEDFQSKEGGQLGLIQLEEISNTKATLWITELYMTCLLKHAQKNIGKCPRTLIVVEEAHTVMPEASTMGVADFESKALIGKISQIALQGRKYGMGLLVLAQRTATVSKTVLTQCNTIISFACYDDTSLAFLKNIYGPDHVAIIPGLPRLTAVAFGNWIRSEQPVVFEVPFNSMKS